MKLDIKIIIILVLGFLLILNFILSGKETPIDNGYEITVLHESNEELVSVNNKLNDSINKLNIEMVKTKELINLNDDKIDELKKQIQKLKNEKNKIQPTVKHMSANVVANTFSEYLDKK
jgi:chromosome segregation ATPase